MIEFIGEIGDHEKRKFLGDAAALLFPIDWPEPFGLVMIEAMREGTPVVAWRCGSVPEVIDEGVTGFAVDSIDEAVRAVGMALRLDRASIRDRFEERFTASRMATNIGWPTTGCSRARILRAGIGSNAARSQALRCRALLQVGRLLETASESLRSRRRSSDRFQDVDTIVHDAGSEASDKCEIEAKTSLTDRPLRTLEDGEAFVALDSRGDFGRRKGRLKVSSVAIPDIRPARCRAAELHI